MLIGVNEIPGSRKGAREEGGSCADNDRRETIRKGMMGVRLQSEGV